MPFRSLFKVITLCIGVMSSQSAIAMCTDTPPFDDDWGWDGSASCLLSEESGTQVGIDTGVCVDTQPIGDGWGWNGSTSCQMGSNNPENPENECVDTGTVGDGWGWNGTTSCRINAATPQPDECVDTGTIGDGWGWNGVESCMLDTDSQTPGPTVIMPVGDSITHGSRGQRSYRYYLIPMLDAAGCSHTMVGSQTTNDTDTGYFSNHESYSTMKADHFLTGHTTWSGTNEGIRVTMSRYMPDVVLLHIGSNDVYYADSNESTVDEIRQMVDIMKSIKPTVNIIISNIIPWFGSSPFTNDILNESQQLGPLIESYVNSMNNASIRFVDVYSGFTRDMMIFDNVHPNDDGEMHIAERFYYEYVSAGLCQ